MAAQIKVLKFAAEELQDDFLGFHLARGFDLREIGLVYYIITSSEHLADALHKAERYSGILNEGVRLHVTLDRSMDIEIDYVNVDRRSDRHQIEFWLVTLLRLCRQATGTRIAPLALKVGHPRVGASTEFTSFFGTDIEFDAADDAIVLSSPMASLPILGRDTHLNKLLEQYADEALSSRQGQRTSLRSDVEKIIPQLLPHGKATASEAARQLGMSSRNLSRKLRMEGATFARILDDLRGVIAQRYLADRELSVSEIAWLLGYQEVSSLTHAFKRWTGLTPRQFRSANATNHA